MPGSSVELMPYSRRRTRSRAALRWVPAFALATARHPRRYRQDCVRAVKSPRRRAGPEGPRHRGPGARSAARRHRARHHRCEAQRCGSGAGRRARAGSRRGDRGGPYPRHEAGDAAPPVGAPHRAVPARGRARSSRREGAGQGPSVPASPERAAPLWGELSRPTRKPRRISARRWTSLARSPFYAQGGPPCRC